MSAEILRKAAKVLRERAKAARDVTGASDWWMESRGLHFTGEYGVRSSGGFVAGDTVEEEAEYIATMHPGVGLAVAEWLDTMAAIWGGGGKYVFGQTPSDEDQPLSKADDPIDPTSLMGRAITLAQFILGGAS